MEYPIPIQNIYYLFCYAWNRLEEGAAIDVDGVDSPELADLFAKVLIGGLHHVIRRGLDRGYVDVAEERASLRGRIDFHGSIPLMLRKTSRLQCEFDELQHDVLTNQILKATLTRLTQVSGLDSGLAHDLRTLSKAFRDVKAPRLSKRLFRRVQIGRSNAFYDFLLKICELIYESTLPEGPGERYRFADILRDERKMARVFEDFVKNFYRLEQRDYRVAPLQLPWDAAGDKEQLEMLPVMRTDINLEKGDRRLIIDTKYYLQSLQEHHGKRSIHSANLYQLFSYLKNAEALEDGFEAIEGMLLYPAVGESVRFE